MFVEPWDSSSSREKKHNPLSIGSSKRMFNELFD
jgi:hypothetical protein